MSDFLTRVGNLQVELKAPKGQTNKFGGYKYRSCEDILEAVKPLLEKYRLVLTVGDDLINFGDRYYICSTATLRDMDSEAEIKNSAYAREAQEKKGMDEAQITGTASSYARKYALNGLFCIDDTKDPDTNEYTERSKQQAFREWNTTVRAVVFPLRTTLMGKTRSLRQLWQSGPKRNLGVFSASSVERRQNEPDISGSKDQSGQRGVALH